MKFLANENIPPKSVTLLRKAGHEVVYATDIMAGASDRAVLEYAHQNELIVITFDRDYGELVYRHKLPCPAGVVYLRFLPLTAEEPGNFILHLITHDEINMLGKFTTARRTRIRQRSLPTKNESNSE